MKTLLVPVDFTATSENAVNFAVEWCRKYGYERIILLKTFYDSMFENIIVSAEYTNISQENFNSIRQDGLDQLHAVCREVTQRIGSTVKVTSAVSEFPLLRSIFEIIQNERPELIILGSDNYRYASGSIIAGNVISIAKASPVRVLVVPAVCLYKPVRQVLLPYNINMANDLERLNYLSNTPQWFDVKLLVLNMGPGNDNIKETEKYRQAKEKFAALLKNFDHEIHYSKEKNVLNGIAAFTRERPVELIIALPGKHSFLYRLTHESISEAIYRNSMQPVLILK